MALKALPLFSSGSQYRAIFLWVLGTESVWGGKDRFLEKLKKVSHRASGGWGVEGGGG